MTTKKSKKQASVRTNLFFELEGKVYIIERTAKGKIVNKDEIDGNLVLQCLLKILEKALKEK